MIGRFPFIIPLLIDNNFISDFQAKAYHFNNSTESSIPTSVNLVTNKTLTTINFDEQLLS